MGLPTPRVLGSQLVRPVHGPATGASAAAPGIDAGPTTATAAATGAVPAAADQQQHQQQQILPGGPALAEAVHEPVLPKAAGVAAEAGQRACGRGTAAVDARQHSHEPGDQVLAGLQRAQWGAGCDCASGAEAVEGALLASCLVETVASSLGLGLGLGSPWAASAVAPVADAAVPK